MLPTAPFGATGHRSSRIIFGAAALGAMSQTRADDTLAMLAPAGINHIDTAASYGTSEDRLRDYLADHRSQVFLATKTGERQGPAARAELERSLERMGVDQVDMIQLHNLVEPDEWDIAHGPAGAVEALSAARDEGLCRFIGVTGHGLRIPSMHLRSLATFPYDSVLIPYSHVLMANPAYASDVDALLAACAQRQVAVQTIKSVARRRWTDDSEPHFSWYEPLRDPAAIARAVRYVLSREQLFVNSSSDARLLPHIIEAAAHSTEAPSPEQLAADVAAHQMRALFDGGALERI